MGNQALSRKGIGVHKTDRQLTAAKALISELKDKLDIDACVRLWDGSKIPLGKNVSSNLEIKIASPGVIGALLRWPTLDNIIRHYVEKGIDLEGGTLIDLGEKINRNGAKIKLGGLESFKLVRKLLPFLLVPSNKASDKEGFKGEITGQNRAIQDNKEFIQFHYDVSNEFYALFLDPKMVYSCAYFKDWKNDLETAQTDKLDLICRKLRLKPGERFLDIGAGWGGLVCHAAQKYGVTAYGITLSKEQLELATSKVKEMGLQERVTFELKDYANLSGTYDKIASIGMYEHIGLKNIPSYMKTVRNLLAEDGLFLNHAISKRAPKKSLFKNRLRPEQKALAKYIFPGGELDDIGHTIWAMERAGFEVHDVEALRLHYAKTCRVWCDRLCANRKAAITQVGEAKYRIWLAYLAGVSLAFTRGSARLFQTLASKSPKRPPPLPPTREDIYRKAASNTI